MGRKRLWAATMICGAALAVAGCGDEGSTSESTAATEVTANDVSVASSTLTVDTDSASIKTWMLEGDCTLMTDKFLEEQTFDDNPETACETFESLFTAPSYGEDDIEITDVRFENDKATAVVGGSPEGVSITEGGEEITSTYHLVFEDGTWKIDSADLN